MKSFQELRLFESRRLHPWIPEHAVAIIDRCRSMDLRSEDQPSAGYRDDYLAKAESNQDKFPNEDAYKSFVKQIKGNKFSEPEVVKEVYSPVEQEPVVEEASEEEDGGEDISKMTVGELKDIAAERGVDVAGLKKAEILEALS